MRVVLKAIGLGLIFGITMAAGRQQADASRRQELLNRAGQGDVRAILDMGRLNDRSVMASLQKIADSPDTESNTPPAAARVALAKLGDGAQFDRVVRELRHANPAVQHEAVQKLAYIGTPAAMRTLIGLLDDLKWRSSRDFGPPPVGPRGEPPQDKLMYVPLSYAAMQALAEIAPNPPVAPGVTPKEEHIPLWRKWWEDVGSRLR